MIARRVCLLLLFAAVGRAQGVDLAEKYPATLDWNENAGARDWTCDENDVWLLSSFTYAFGDQFAIELGGSIVVFGKHGTNVVWAGVFPDEPGKIVKASNGEGESIASVWLRFNPALVGDLFPAASVIGPGEANGVVWGKRLYNRKIRASWQAGDQPVIPWKHSLVIDIETEGGPRRFFMIDTRKGEAKYEPFFEKQTLPPLVSVTPEDALKAFDDVWEAFDREYPMFAIKPHVDWNALKGTYRPRMTNARTTYEAAAVIAEMLAHLEDLHVFVKAGEEFLPGYTRERPFNMNTQAVRPNFPDIQDNRQQLAWGRTADGIGYINVYGLGDKELPRAFDAALEQLGETWSLIIDLRMNGGGDELLAREMAGRFLDRAYVYSLNQYRNGPDHTDLGPKLQRQCEPRGPWRYAAPVAVLVGQRTMSSAESFALMLAQASSATLIGDRTAGSSANPRLVQTAGGIQVNLPRWLDLTPDGKPIDGVGVQPDIEIEASPEDFASRSSGEQPDPVLEKALEHLRAIPETERKSGKPN